MLKLRINPIVAKDLKNIRDYIAEDNEEYAAKTIKEIYGKFENLQMFPGMGSDLSKRCIFRKNCASVPEERSAIPLQTEQSSAG